MLQKDSCIRVFTLYLPVSKQKMCTTCSVSKCCLCFCSTAEILSLLVTLMNEYSHVAEPIS